MTECNGSGYWFNTSAGVERATLDVTLMHELTHAISLINGVPVRGSTLLATFEQTALHAENLYRRRRGYRVRLDLEGYSECLQTKAPERRLGQWYWRYWEGPPGIAIGDPPIPVISKVEMSYHSPEGGNFGLEELGLLDSAGPPTFYVEDWRNRPPPFEGSSGRPWFDQFVE